MTIAAATLPFWAGTFLLLLLRRRGLGWREASLAAAVLCGVLVVASTELLSLCSALNRGAVAAFWLLCVAVAGVCLLRTRTAVADGRRTIPKLSALEKVSTGAICGILTVTLLIALVAPPNTWDSLTYHMTRVVFWIQNESVAHFPTNNLRQIELNPFAEFAILHLQLLAAGDRFANLVQWLSFGGCIVGASWIAELLGGTRRAQVLAALFGATLPMAVLQASSTQNDLVVSLWLMSFVAFGLRLRERPSPWTAALMALSLGLAILTKGTAYIFAFPFVLWFIAREAGQAWTRGFLISLALAGGIVCLNAGHYARNFSLFGRPIDSGETSYGNDRLGGDVVLSNLSRNVALHLITPWVSANQAVISALDSFHELIGLQADSPETTWPGQSPSQLGFSVQEDSSGNFLHLLLFGGAVVLGARSRQRELLAYGAAVLGGCFLFCILLRWQPWHSRLHVPEFVLLSPLAALAWVRVRARWISLVVVSLIIGASPYLLLSRSRPVFPRPGAPFSIFTFPRAAAYLVGEPNRGAALFNAGRVIRSRGFRSVGIQSGVDSWEYPLWVYTRTGGLEGPEFAHLGAMNVSGRIRRSPLNPDVLVRIAEDGAVYLLEP